MESVNNTPTNKNEAVPVEPPREANHTERIKVQVLAKVGKPPRLDRVEVCQHHNGKYRVNIWQRLQANKTIAVAPSSRIGLSYYLTVSDTGEIIHSDPPLAKACSSA
jgi:hypothetical protein